MLVAMLRANPNAFIGGNINRMKAGAVLDLPDASQAAAVPAPEARRTVVAQSRDFGDYRRRLAENAPLAVAPADRQSSGRLQANVEDRSKVAAAPDKLTIARQRPPVPPTTSWRRRARRRKAALAWPSCRRTSAT
jgi:pilus assembly protein FimV